MVVVGSNLEVVNGGSGNDTIDVTASTIGATIDGGTSGQSLLVVSGGGTVNMGASITRVATVDLALASSAYKFTANGIAGLVVDDLSTHADTIAAGAAGQTLTGGASGQETFVGFGSGVTTYKDTAPVINGDTINNFNPADKIDLAGLAFGPSTTVSYTPITANSGTLDVFVSSVLQAQVALFGQLAAASFTAHDDGAGGTLILDPPLSSPLAVTKPHLSHVSAFA